MSFSNLYYLYFLTSGGVKEKAIASKNFIQKKKEEYTMLINSLNKSIKHYE
jgi:hypothetical protein